MQKKISVIIVVMLLCFSSLVLVTDDFKVAASPGEDVELDFEYIYNVTEELSEVIFTVYSEPAGELARGRAFGTAGEYYAATDILQPRMIGIVGVDNVELDQIIGNKLETWELDNKLEVKLKSLTVNETPIEQNEFYMTTRWSLDEGKWHIFDWELADEFDYTNLNVELYPNIVQYICDYINHIINNIKDYDFKRGSGSFNDYLDSSFEEYFDYNYDLIDPEDSETFPTYLREVDVGTGNFVFIQEDPTFHPTLSEFPVLDTYDPFKSMVFFTKIEVGKKIIKDIQKVYPNCKGIIRYDYDDNLHNTNFQQIKLPYININGSLGDNISADVDNYTIDFTLEQEWKPNVTSYNVIGKIDGLDPTTGEKPDKTVIVSSLYDSMWCQGTTDSAIGMGIVMGIMKYFQEYYINNNIYPKYNIEFIGFAGEEYGAIGSRYYAKDNFGLLKPAKNAIAALINLNQLGFDQRDPPRDLKFNIATSKSGIVPILESITDIADFEDSMGESISLNINHYPWGTQTDDRAFAIRSVPTVMFLQDNSWTRHHRDGNDHNNGDSIQYYDEKYVKLTAQLILNVTKYFTINPDCWFKNNYPDYDTIDTNGDNVADKVDITYYIKSILPHDLVKVKTSIIPKLYSYTPPPNYPSTDSDTGSLFNNVDGAEPADCYSGCYGSPTFNTFNPNSPTYPIIGDTTQNVDVDILRELKWKNDEDSDGPDVDPLNNALYQVKEHIVDRTWTTDTVTLEIPAGMAFTDCKIVVELYNSTGIIDDKANCTWTNEDYMGPDTDGPLEPAGGDNLISLSPFDPGDEDAAGSCELRLQTTDPNNDPVEYQVIFETSDGTIEYSEWTKPQPSGANFTQKFTWTKPDVTHAKVRARDNKHSPNQLSNWSEPINLTMEPGCWINTTPLPSSSTTVLVDSSIDFWSVEYQISDAESWEWDFDDGTNSSDNNTDHNYNTSGTYTVNLSVTNATGTYYYEIDVNILETKADFNVSAVYVKPGENIDLYDTSTSVNTINNWTWNFGDGNISYMQNTTHNYTIDGEYNVTLKVTDNESNNHTCNKIIYVDSTTPDTLLTPNPPVAIGLGETVTLYGDFYDNNSGIQTARINITKPDGTYINTSMPSNISHPYDYEYVFNDTMQTGEYYYYFWLKDNANNTNNSYCRSFHILNILGYGENSENTQNITDRITGSKFILHENGTADYISAYIQTNETPPVKAKCMIYRANDSTLVGTTEENTPNTGDNPYWTVFNFTGSKPLLKKDAEYVLVCWSNDTCYLYYDNSSESSGYYNDTSYGSAPSPIVWTDNETRVYSICCGYSTKPEIINVSHTPDTVGFGFNVTISADVFDDTSGVRVVRVDIEHPDNTSYNVSMTSDGNNSYSYVFDDTWKVGQYNYTVWACDRHWRSNTSAQGCFNVSANATISICTLKDSYGSNETINITDPPGEGEGEGGSGLTLVGRGESWNKYYNETAENYVGSFYSGPINYPDETGTYHPINNTILVLPQDHPARQYGYVAGCEKNVINVYFKKWSNSSYPVCFAYNKSQNSTIHTLRSKLIRVGYVDPGSNWDTATVQNVQSVQGEIQGDYGVYPGVFTGTNVTWTIRNGRLKEEILVSQDAYDAISNHPPSSYGLSNESSWLVWVTRLDYTGLSPELNVVKQTGNFTTNVSDDRILFKNAADQILCSFPIGTVYEQDNESNFTRLRYRMIQHNGEYYLLAGAPLGWFNNASYPVVIDPSSDFESGSGDGYVERDKYFQSWTEVRDASTGTSSGTGDTTFCTRAYVYDPGTQLIRRVFLPFNTSSISGGIVNNATLYCRGTVGMRGSICAMEWDEGQVVSTADYDGFTGSVWDSIPYNSWNPLGWNTFDIPNDEIDTGGGDGYTDICLRNYDKDVGDSKPAPYHIGYRTDMYSSDGTYPPYLNINWTAIDPPTMSTNAATSVSATSATMGGSVDDAGGDNPTRYIDWDNDSSGSPYAVQENKGVGGIGSFSHTVSGILTPGTMYWYRARGVNSGGTGVGSELTFLTAPDVLSVFSATLNGSYQMDLSWSHGSGGDKVYLEYAEGSEPSPWNKGNGTVVPGGSSGVFNGTSTSHTGLDAGTTYYYKAWPIASDDGQDSDGSTTKPYGTPSTANSMTAVISDPWPSNGSENVSLTPMLNITVNNAENSSMNVTWYSNSSGSWQVFWTNNSVGNGTYHQVFANASVNGQWWYWKVNVSIGSNYSESDVFRFYTGVQSKIVNMGTTDISGYLLIQIHYFNVTLDDWVVVGDVIRDDVVRVINSSEELGLDLLFNGLVNSDDLFYGNGSYRLYAVFLDPYDNILQCDDSSKLEAWYVFEVDY